MEALIFIIIVFVIWPIVKSALKGKPKEASAMPHEHRQSGAYDTFNRRKRDNSTGAMPHEHGTGKYRSMADASNLPPGYILLNGEMVRVADLENR